MRAIIVYGISILLSVPFLYARPSAEKTDGGEVIVYAYDSFTSDWGLGKIIAKRFKEKYGYTLTLVSHGDAIITLTAARKMDGTDPRRPDVIIGIDNNTLPIVLADDFLREYKPPDNVSTRRPAWLFENTDGKLLPLDFGYLSFVYDKNRVGRPPVDLEDLTDQRFERSIVISDPRTSSPGLAFLFWTIHVYGNAYLDYWKRLRPSLLAIVDSWSTAYGLFTAGEASIVLSYNTSPAYHAEYEDNYDIKASIFEEGNYLQIEYAGITRYAQNPDGARQLLNFLQSKDVQKEIPLKNIMYPVNNDVIIPESFSYAAIPEHPVTLSAVEIREHQERWLNDWQQLMNTLQ